MCICVICVKFPKLGLAVIIVFFFFRDSKDLLENLDLMENKDPKYFS